MALAAKLHMYRRIFPAVGSTVEDIKFTSAGNLLASYYGGVSYWSTEPGTPGLQLPYKALTSVQALECLMPKR